MGLIIVLAAIFVATIPALIAWARGVETGI